MKTFEPLSWTSTRHGRCANCTTGFSVVELLVVLAIIGLLASLLLPALGRAKTAAQSTYCQSNLSQLEKAWRMYVDDHDDCFPPNISRKIGFNQVNVTVDSRVPWVLGNAKLDTNTANNKAGVLFKYAESAAIYHCPADKANVRGHPSIRRSRSYSTHEYFNSDIVSGTAADTLNSSEVILKKFSQLVNPGTSGTFVFIDEHKMSIDDGILGVALPPKPEQPPGQLRIWSGFPGDRHNNGANLSYADGSVERHQWRARRIITSYTGGKVFIDPDDIENLEDEHWLNERIPRPP